MGFLFENPDHQIFYPIVADDVAFGPRNLGLSKSEINSRVVQACRDVEILHLLERETASLSLGEKTLVALAGVLSMRPKILLLDAPGVGLDIWTKSKVTNLLQELANHTTLVISSNDTEFLEIADRIFLLHNGKVVGKYKNYQNFRKSLAKREGVLHHDLKS